MRAIKPYLFTGTAIAVVAVLLVTAPLTEDLDWHFNGTAIEACSCPLFCPCYFNTETALHQTEHGAEHFCKFNMAYKVNEGHHGDTDLSGVKFWVAGDLGANWKEGNTE